MAEEAGACGPSVLPRAGPGELGPGDLCHRAAPPASPQVPPLGAPSPAVKMEAVKFTKRIRFKGKELRILLNVWAAQGKPVTDHLLL